MSEFDRTNSEVDRVTTLRGGEYPEPDPTLHECIAAAVAEKRRAATKYQSVATLAACDHADKVLARHAEYATTDLGYWCAYDRKDAPCPDVRDLADLWLGKGWDQ